MTSENETAPTMTSENETAPTMAQGTAEDEVQISALQDNIERKGKNAYYYTHSHKATGPAWDGKQEPRLLARETSNLGHRMSKLSTFDYHKSNITTYAFLDDGMKVKLYIDMVGVGEKCTDEDVSLDYTETSFCLVVNTFKPEPQCLSFGKLAAEITGATFRLKQDRVIITLKKAKEGEWHTVNDKGSPDHDFGLGDSP
jgi:hypothetical protein